MALPSITSQQVLSAIPTLVEAVNAGQGGQKLVFRVRIKDDPQLYALKFTLLPTVSTPFDTQDVETSQDETTAPQLARVKREVEIMRDCNSPYMVKLGPISLNTLEIGNQHLLYFSESFIEGACLQDIVKSQKQLETKEVIRLGLHITKAIKELWSLGKIHRDIKPGNIMRRNSNGDFVLLDAGLAFDVNGESLSAGFAVGTLLYFSPEQFEYTNRRSSDFRSDLFSLGVTMYQLATNQHPFYNPGDGSGVLYSKITKFNPPPPSTLNQGIPIELDEVILRMLKKVSHLRYRKCDELIEILEELQKRMEQ